MYQRKFYGVNEVKDVLTRLCGYPASVADVACDKTERYLDTFQKLPPAKGAFIKYTVNEETVAGLVADLRRLDSKILKRIAQRAAHNPAYTALYNFEKFQSSQKGPVQKVTPGRVLEALSKILDNSSKDLMSVAGRKLIDKGAELLKAQLMKENLTNSIHSSDVRPQFAWSKMAHSSVRGIP